MLRLTSLLILATTLLLVQGSILMPIPTNITSLMTLNGQQGMAPCTCPNGKIYFPSTSNDTFEIVEVDPSTQTTTTYSTSVFEDMASVKDFEGPAYLLCSNNTLYISWTYYNKSNPDGEVYTISNGLYEISSLLPISE